MYRGKYRAMMKIYDFNRRVLEGTSEIDINEFLVSEELEEKLREICTTHYLAGCEVRKNGERLAISEIEEKVQGKLVKLTFTLGYERSTGLKGGLISVDLLE